MIHQARIEAAPAPAERIARALEEGDPSPLAVGLFDRGNGRCEVFAHYDRSPSRETLLALIADAADPGELGPLAIEEIAPEDWVRLSQGKRGPVRAGRFFIHGSHDKDHAPRRRYVLEIDAAQAFGTAHHASTRGCLLALDALFKRRSPRTLLDLGSGTGILAIAAANALKRKVLASDNDPIAVAIAAENARKNGAGTLVAAIEAEGFAHPRLRNLKADLICANLLERALYHLAPAFARHLRSYGVAVLSGLTQAQAPAIEARFRAHGFVMEKRIILEGWTTLVITRRNMRPRRD